MANDKYGGIALLMLGFTVLGSVLATAVTKQIYEQRLDQQSVRYELAMVKKHMTTILQLNDCYINEAFYTLDRDIFEAKKFFERNDLPPALTSAYQTANATILDYYARFDMQSECEDCVPRSPMPSFKCTAA